MPKYLPSDPLFAVQWHLLNTGTTPGAIAGFDINVVRVWPDYTGQGVLVTATEAGMDETHPDLIKNYRPDLSWNLATRQPGSAAAVPGDPAYNHGTPVLGLIGATEGNGIGGVGVAWNSQLAMHLMDFNTFADDLDISQVLFSAQQVIASQTDIWSNSWGLGGAPFYQTGNSAAIHDMLRDVATLGRDGLGTITVFSAGNDSLEYYDTNYRPTSHQPYAITVGAIEQNGKPAIYTTPGSSVLISAPGSNPASIVTTDRQGEEGYNTTPGNQGDYTDQEGAFFNGTSAAAPIVSGVIALLLEANPTLSYRDVQEILAYSAKRTHFLPQPIDNTVNGAPDWNGGGLLHGYAYGFGTIDALAAVRLAESWQKTSTVHSLALRTADSASDPDLVVNTGETRTTEVRFNAPARAEYITVNLDLTSHTLDQVSVFLVSPSGTTSPLLMRPPASDENGTAASLPVHLVDTLGSVRHWGENIAGTWTLRIENTTTGTPVTLHDWSITAYSPDNAGPGTQIFTDEFATMAMLQPWRSELITAKGQHLNAAAVTSDITLDLTLGSGVLAGVNVTLQDPADFLNITSGDGHDTLKGNARDNQFLSGRGHDTLYGEEGIDAARFIRPLDQYRIDTTDQGVVVQGLAHGGESSTTLNSIELLVFKDQVKLAQTPDNPYGFNEHVYLERNPDVAQAIAYGQLSSGYEHFELWGRTEGRTPTVLFDEQRYLTQNPDVAQAVATHATTSGYQHYLQHGWSEGRAASPWFNSAAYLNSNPDVAHAQIDPLSHYLAFGVHEGRSIVAYDDAFWV